MREADDALRELLLNRVLKDTLISDADSCWLWQACRTKGGYGRFHIARKFGGGWSAHVAMYIAAYGVLVNQVLHNCHVPACVNPYHLHDGTQSQNICEAVARGTHFNGGFRNYRPPDKHGEKSNTAKLTEVEAKEILALLAKRQLTNEVIAKRYNVSPATVSAIKVGKRWPHLQPHLTRLIVKQAKES